MALDVGFVAAPTDTPIITPAVASETMLVTLLARFFRDFITSYRPFSISHMFAML